MASLRLVAGVVALGFLPACTGGWALGHGNLAAGREARVAHVTEQLVALPGAGEAARGEAGRLARRAVEFSEELAARYQIVRPAGLHNCLVNTKRRERGLCWHWMKDLYPQLRALGLQRYELVCAVRDEGRKFREHHCVVAVPKGRPFEDGLVLDPWEKGGHLIAFPVRGAKRPWFYDDPWTRQVREEFRTGTSLLPH